MRLVGELIVLLQRFDHAGDRYLGGGRVWFSRKIQIAQNGEVRSCRAHIGKLI